MASAIKHKLQTMRKYKDKGHEWFNTKSDVITVKLERLMIMCNGYNKIQPVRLSRGVTTMVSEASLVTPSALTVNNPCQFRPCLGSRRSRREATTPTRHDIVRTRNQEDQLSAAKTRTTFFAPTDDQLHWGSDLSHIKPTKLVVRPQPAPGAPSLIRYPKTQSENITKPPSTKTYNRKNDPKICCDCGCMIEEIDRAFEVVERSVAQRQRQRNRMLTRQYTAPAKCR